MKRLFVGTITISMLLLSACSAFKPAVADVSGRDNVGLGWEHDNPAGPNAGTWNMVDLPDGRKYTVDEPPANDSEKTKRDIEELRQLTEKRTEEDVKLIRRWSSEITGPNTNWSTVTEEMLAKYPMSPPEAARVNQIVSGTIYTASVAVFKQKYMYLRPRPTHLDPNITLIENFEVPAHPAYPSAHATTGWAASTVLSYIFPNEKELFISMAKESDLSRKLAGVHYESDNAAGRKLGTQIATDIIKGLTDDNAPLQYEVAMENHGH